MCCGFYSPLFGVPFWTSLIEIGEIYLLGSKGDKRAHFERALCSFASVAPRHLYLPFMTGIDCRLQWAYCPKHQRSEGKEVWKEAGLRWSDNTQNAQKLAENKVLV